MRPLLAFLMNKRPMCPYDDGGDLSVQLAHAGATIFLVGLVWAIGRVIIFRKAKQRSFYPYAAMLLGACAFIAAGILQETS
jgi:hypothetical protein